MLHVLLASLLLAPLPAEDPWAEVAALKSGTELRIYKSGSSQPVPARMDELKEESLLVVVKNEQVAIKRADIDRIDARPSGGSRVTRESKATQEMKADSGVGGRPGNVGPSTSSSSSLTIGGKPDFKTVYRRSGKIIGDK
jgi:hypothetical protein